MRNAGRRTFAMLFAAAAIGSGIVFVTSAHADTITVPGDTADGQTVTRDLADKCNSGSPERTCTWSNAKLTIGDGKAEVVGTNGGSQKFVNCGAGTLTETLSWSRTSGHETTFGGSVTFGGALGNLFNKLEAEAGLNLGGTWSKERTFESATQMEVPSGETGWVVHTERRVTVNGTLTVVAGENTFILPEATITAPHGKEVGVISTHTRKHTPADKAICDNAPAPIVTPGTPERLKAVAFDE